MSMCSDCHSVVDVTKPCVVRVYVKDRRGREHELCRVCWSRDLDKTMKVVRR